VRLMEYRRGRVMIVYRRPSGRLMSDLLEFLSWSSAASHP
jgi:hypothetical protein